jgi:hypothetical protein
MSSGTLSFGVFFEGRANDPPDDALNVFGRLWVF